MNRTTTREAARTSAALDAAVANPHLEISKAGGPSVHDLPWTPYVKREAAPVVLLLLDHQDVAAVAIQRASRVADALRGSLHVVLALPNDVETADPQLALSPCIASTGWPASRRRSSPRPR
jgi:hypothetical protein